MTTKSGHAFTIRRIASRLLLLIFTLAFALGLVPAGKAQKTSASTGQSRFTALDGARVHYKSYQITVEL